MANGPNDGEKAAVTTPLFKLDIEGRYIAMVLLFGLLTLGAGYVSYMGQLHIAKEQDEQGEMIVKALNSLANEQRFTTCVLWVVSDKSFEAKSILDENLLKQRCWWIRKDMGGTTQ